jgi:hypothetical protein
VGKSRNATKKRDLRWRFKNEVYQNSLEDQYPRTIKNIYAI